MQTENKDRSQHMLEFDNDCCHGKTFILLAITLAVPRSKRMHIYIEWMRCTRHKNCLIISQEIKLQCTNVNYMAPNLQSPRMHWINTSLGCVRRTGYALYLMSSRQCIHR